MNMGGGSLWRASSQFPAGLRVLVVDDDPIFLKILEKMLQNCLYEVTTCTRAEVALSMLRESKTRFDIVLSDVHMPDMNGFKLLEHIGLEMDLPVIMMSVDDGKDVVMKGVTHGACDYLIKPVRIEAVKNIWQHVVRKRRNELKELELSGSVVDSDRQRKPSDDTDYASSVNEGSWRNSKRRKSEEEEGEERDGALKKPRVVWSVELHQQFVTAVSQLGIDKAVPKKILELMNVPGLTRENVASHLQKYRLYLRRLSGVSQHQSGMNTAFMGSQEASFGSMSSLDGLDLQALAVSGQLPPQSLATLQTGGLGRSTAISANAGINVPLVDQRNIFSSEIPKLRFGAGLQLSNDGKPMNLLHGLPITMEPKQLAQLQQSVQSFSNVSLQVSEGSSTFLNMPPTSLRKSLLSHVDVVHGNESSSLMMQMAQSQSRGQLLDEIAASALSSSVGQEVFSNEISGQIMERNGTIVNGRSVELPGNGFPLANTTGVSILTSTGIFQGGGSKELKVPRDSAPSYDIFSELFQGKSQDWGLQNVALTFDASQHVNSLQGKPDLSPSFLTNQDCASMQKNGQNMNTSVIGKSMFLRETIEQGNTKNSTQRPNNPMADNSIKVKTETMPDSRSETVLLPEHFGQDDLMSALLKQQQGVGLVESEYNFDGYTID